MRKPILEQLDNATIYGDDASETREYERRAEDTRILVREYQSEVWTKVYAAPKPAKDDVTGSAKPDYGDTGKGPLANERTLARAHAREQHQFDYQYAMNYVHATLRNMATGSAPHVQKNGTVKDHKKAKSGSHVYHVQTDTVLDIVQDAFLAFWRQREQLIPRLMEHVISSRRSLSLLLTAKVCQYAVRHYLRRELGQAVKDRETMLLDYARHYAYMYDGAKRVKGGCDGDIYDTLAEWLSTGASQADISSVLGIPKQRISDMVAHLRTTIKLHRHTGPLAMLRNAGVI